MLNSKKLTPIEQSYIGVSLKEAKTNMSLISDIRTPLTNKIGVLQVETNTMNWAVWTDREGSWALRFSVLTSRLSKNLKMAQTRRF